ncbi:HNH endonuclease [Pseudoxanthomonas mexicana]|uniref:HNH endonuclease n=1 Tax=Pseudoxanthomonas mexicana TaxID=128785 RepID=UPI0022F38E33|nr:hypothetical protein [Pseudoxanthomonas mexicana]WBX94490.1 hypothetical protein PE064_04665 [Pseudoxanthomonas mexicana]
MKAEITAFTFDRDEQVAIEAALLTDKPWYDPGVAAIRRRIKDFHLGLTQYTCCYCQRDLHGEFTMVIDVEHVLPSSEYKPQTFLMWNLSASCKRCNMDIKKNDVSFIQGLGSLEDSSRYKLAHPNFDNPEDHLARFVEQVGRSRIVKYVIHTPDKGRFTYEYFKLRELETSSYDEAQGANRTDPDHADKFESMRARVEELWSATEGR